MFRFENDERAIPPKEQGYMVGYYRPLDPCPYKKGTPECREWHDGYEEGRSLAYQDKAERDME